MRIQLSSRQKQFLPIILILSLVLNILLVVQIGTAQTGPSLTLSDAGVSTTGNVTAAGAVTGDTIESSGGPNAAYSYMIYPKNTTHYAAKAANGTEIDLWSSTNASYVTLSAIGTGSVNIVFGNGSFVFDSPLGLLPIKTNLEGIGQFGTTQFAINTDSDFVSLSSYSSISDIEIKAVVDGYSHSLISFSDSNDAVSYSSVDHCFLWRGMTASSTTGTGITFLSSNTSRGVSFNTVKDTAIWGRLNESIKIQTSNDGWINGNKFESVINYATPFGIVIYKLGSANPTENTFDSYSYQAHTTYTNIPVTLAGKRNSLINSKIWDINDTTYGLKIVSGAIMCKIENTYLSGLISDLGTATEYQTVTRELTSGISYSEHGGSVSFTSGAYLSHKLFTTPSYLMFSAPRTAVLPVLINEITGTRNATHVQLRLYWFNGTEVTSAVSINYFGSVNAYN